MTQELKPTAAITHLKTSPFINRELAWLSFNARVLQEATDPKTPLLERLRFLGIYSNNRDEFYRVRVASLKRLATIGKKATPFIGDSPESVLAEIEQIIAKQQQEFEKIYRDILTEMRKNNVYIIDEKSLTEEQKIFVRNYFDDEIVTNLFPILLDERKPPYLQDNSGYLLVKLISQKNEKKIRFALIEVPSKTNSRFITLPKQGNRDFVILLDDVVRLCLPNFFATLGFTFAESYNIKLTRDADLDIDNDISQDMIAKLTKGLKKREKGKPVRLVVDAAISQEMLTFLMHRLNMGKNDKPLLGVRYQNFKDFINFPSLNRQELLYQNPHALHNPYLYDSTTSILKTIRQRDLMLFYPYQTFDHIIALLREASVEPTVESIQITLYRVASISKIANALINAVKNGKKVMAIVELKARFDEENNIYWANKLGDAGVEIIYGLPDLKVHAKLFLIKMFEKGKTVYLSHIGTGNFNEHSARIYTDITLLTCDQHIGAEIEDFFDSFADRSFIPNFKILSVAPFNMRQNFLALIDKEISFVRMGKTASIILKVNHLVDPQMIQKLYQASQAGVKIKLIVRGICSLVCGVKGVSENIIGISILDKYLEHARVFVFENDNHPLYFISSSDWMTRNLDYRYEVAVPIYNHGLQKNLKAMLELQLADNSKARILDANLSNQYKQPKIDEPAIRAQEDFYQFLVVQKNQILNSQNKGIKNEIGRD